MNIWRETAHGRHQTSGRFLTDACKAKSWAPALMQRSCLVRYPQNPQSASNLSRFPKTGRRTKTNQPNKHCYKNLVRPCEISGPRRLYDTASAQKTQHCRARSVCCAAIVLWIIHQIERLFVSMCPPPAAPPLLFRGIEAALRSSPCTEPHGAIFAASRIMHDAPGPS